MNHKNLGRLAVDLKLEDRVLEEGLLPEKMVEKSAFATAIIDRLIENGNWVKASKLLFENGPIRYIYDGNKADLEIRLVQSISGKQFEEPYPGYDNGRDNRRFHEEIKFLLQNVSSDALAQLLSRDDFPIDVTKELIMANKESLGEGAYRANLTKLGKRVQEKNPHHAHQLFSYATNESEIRHLYDALEENFKGRNIPLMLEIAEKGHDVRDSLKKVESIVRKSIPLIEKMDKDDADINGERVVDLINSAVERYKIKLSDEEKDILEVAKVNYFSEYKMSEIYDSISPKTRLAWALNKWGSHSPLAYKIFCEENYSGKEILKCASLIFNIGYDQRKSLSDSINFKKEHLEAILSEIPQDDVLKREVVAVKLKDRNELVRLAGIYSDSHRVGGKFPCYDLSKAYQLLRVVEADEKSLSDVRKRLIKTELEDRRKTGEHPFFSWLSHDDIAGYEQVFDAVILESKPKILEYAYKLVDRRTDPSRLVKAREKILKSVSPLYSVKFFASNKDTVGYDAALDALSKEYDVPKEKVEQLFTSKKKAYSF